MTKEQLIAENAELKTENAELKTKLALLEEEYSEYGDVARKNLAKTLCITTEYNERQYGYTEKKTRLPEWSEIYARIGELIVIESQKTQRINLESMEERLQVLWDKCFSKENN